MEFDRNDTRTKVIDLIAQQLDRKPETITDQDTFDSLGADSLDRVEIVMKLEEHFNIEIDDAEAEKIKSVDELVNYIHSLRK